MDVTYCLIIFTTSAHFPEMHLGFVIGKECWVFPIPVVSYSLEKEVVCFKEVNHFVFFIGFLCKVPRLIYLSVHNSRSSAYALQNLSAK